MNLSDDHGHFYSSMKGDKTPARASTAQQDHADKVARVPHVAGCGDRRRGGQRGDEIAHAFQAMPKKRSAEVAEYKTSRHVFRLHPRVQSEPEKVSKGLGQPEHALARGGHVTREARSTKVRWDFFGSCSIMSCSCTPFSPI